MRHPSRIKVSDLLLHVGQVDTIVIDHVLLDAVPGLDPDGITGNLRLQSIDNFTIIATLQDISCRIHDVSDVSGDPYVRPVSVKEFPAYFVVQSQDTVSHDEEDSPIFFIDEKNETIDMSEMLYQSILLQEPFVKRTPEEEIAYKDAMPDDLDEIDETPLGGLIVFRKGGK